MKVSPKDCAIKMNRVIKNSYILLHSFIDQLAFMIKKKKHIQTEKINVAFILDTWASHHG